jgi:hypothetical protein
MIDEVATEFTGDPVRFVFSSWGEGAVLEDLCLVGMEACATAHYWARELSALGHEVWLSLFMPQRNSFATPCIASSARTTGSSMCAIVAMTGCSRWISPRRTKHHRSPREDKKHEGLVRTMAPAQTLHGPRHSLRCVRHGRERARDCPDAANAIAD